MIVEKLMLHGARVLVLEDDYYLATDLTSALEAAGGQVVGPFGDAGAAAEALAADPPDCALVDLNLGAGISFELPHELARRSVPFAFVTGYDRAAIPRGFAATVRLEKPIAADRVVAIAAALVASQRS